ncbi:hypothetical protein CV770_18370 [Bradyrhizobium sp. AC87j1]|uniref:hypothetical protein n=1 Tax=Bradyrhizobium sp. AC87j1 TaxID=2055894 RepID=UPI000CEBAA48|nr:hypothetical protein [Bradyrhizobium sp. AC87j1]PPQ17933.1 hypothetical protein CV770_18370 [Bradyrhizobium sp. AC87j1]
MDSRTASVIVCDDALFGLTGKAFLNGVYTTDIMIPGELLMVQQLVFYFTVETPKAKPFKSVTLRVSPPGSVPSQVEVPLASLQAAQNPNRPSMILRGPLLIQQLVLRPGKIEAKVITETEELDAGGIWVVSGGAQPPRPD